MAHTYTIQTLADTTKRSLIALTGRFDDSIQEGPNTKIYSSNLFGALSTDGRPASGNARAVYLSNYHISVRELKYDIAAPANAYALLYWASANNANTDLITLHNSGEIRFSEDKGCMPEPLFTTQGLTGDIGIQTFGFTANSSYFIVLDIGKGPIKGQSGRDYDMGQFEDPSAFNAGRRGVYGATHRANFLTADAVANTDGVWSLRKMVASYTGNCVQIRRSLDNALSNIGFNGTTIELDVGALDLWIGSGNGYVSIWYDQTGLGNDLRQANTVLQPQIVPSLLAANGKPSILWGDGTGFGMSANGNSSINDIFSANGFTSTVINIISTPVVGPDRIYQKGT